MRCLPFTGSFLSSPYASFLPCSSLFLSLGSQTLCSLGTLGRAIDSGRFLDPATGGPDIRAILLTVRLAQSLVLAVVVAWLHTVVGPCSRGDSKGGSHAHSGAALSLPLHLLNPAPPCHAPPLPAAQTCEIAGALTFLHGVGVIHGDLGANNVLLCPSERSDWDARGYTAKVSGTQLY